MELELLKEKVIKAQKQGFVYINGKKKKVNGYGLFGNVVILFDDGRKVCNEDFDLDDRINQQ